MAQVRLLVCSCVRVSVRQWASVGAVVCVLAERNASSNGDATRDTQAAKGGNSPHRGGKAKTAVRSSQNPPNTTGAKNARFAEPGSGSVAWAPSKAGPVQNRGHVFIYLFSPHCKTRSFTFLLFRGGAGCFLALAASVTWCGRGSGTSNKTRSFVVFPSLFAFLSSWICWKKKERKKEREACD